MMEAYFFVSIDRWGKCRLSTVPLNAGNDGMTAGLPQALANKRAKKGEAETKMLLQARDRQEKDNRARK